MFKENSIALLIIQIIPFALGISFVFILPQANKNPSGFGIFCIGLFVVGFALFLYSKIINIKKGRLIPFGSKGMTKYQRWFYRIGYALMLIGFVLWGF